jgi:hypothetical protein
MLKKSVSLVEFSTTPTVSVMTAKNGDNVANEQKDQSEQANSRVNAALAQLGAQEGAAAAASTAGGAQEHEHGEGRGIFTME